MRIAFFFLFQVCLTCAAQFERGTPVPEWVELEPLPTSKWVDPYDVMAGAYPLLINQQFNQQDEVDFYQIITQTVNQYGVDEASKVVLQFDTSYAQAHVHAIRIWRDGRALDKLESTNFRRLNREEMLEYGILTGTTTMLGIIPDVRRGDAVEIQFSYQGYNPILEGQHFFVNPIESTNPIEVLVMRVLCDPSATVSLQSEQPEQYEILNKTKRGHRDFRFRRDSIPGFEYSLISPAWILPREHLLYNEVDSWSAVADWAETLFECDTSIDAQAVLEELGVATAPLAEQVQALVDFVQMDIRYLGEEAGIGSFQPRAPQSVYDNRCGDCKDKSLLLVTLLKAIGIENAHPTLVSTQLGPGLEHIPPTGSVFDHCIVHLEWQDQDVWLDPTITNQGGPFTERYCPRYRKVLRVGSGEAGWVEMSPAPTTNKAYSKEIWSVQHPDSVSTFEVYTTLQGVYADNMRAQLEYLNRRDLSIAFEQGYQRFFPGVKKTGKLGIEDDKEHNTLRFHEQYEVHDIWTQFSGNPTFVYEPLVLYDVVSNMAYDSLSHPIGFMEDIQTELDVEFQLFMPHNIQEEAVHLDNMGFSYDMELKQPATDQVTMSFQIVGKPNLVSPEAFRGVCEDMNHLMTKTSLHLSHMDATIHEELMRQLRRDFEHSQQSAPDKGEGGR